MVCMARSTLPLAGSIFMLDVTCVNEYFFENLVKTNCGSLSDLRMLAIPCLVNICVWFHLFCGTPAGFVTAWFPAVT